MRPAQNQPEWRAMGHTYALQSMMMMIVDDDDENSLYKYHLEVAMVLLHIIQHIYFT